MKSNFKGLASIQERLSMMKIPGRVVFIIMGVLSTIWFLIRVIPKPQRAVYPCMKAAAPIMSGFVIYMLTLGGAVMAYKKAKNKFLNAKYLAASIFAIFAIVLGVAFFIHESKLASANIKLTVVPPSDGPNTPMGIARGIFPGRVIWNYNQSAIISDPYTSSTDYHFLASHNDQAKYDTMFKQSIIKLTGATSVHNAWDSLFIFHNRSRGLGNVSYSSGQKIFIKINQVTAGYATSSMDCYADNTGQAATGGTQTTPFVALSMLRQLVNVFGVAQTDIYIGDPNSHIFKHNYDVWYAEFPNIHYIDASSSCGRTQISPSSSSKLIYFSDKGKVLGASVTGDNLCDINKSANYLINLANLKPHMRAGVSSCAKNYFGTPTNGCSRLHKALVAPNEGEPDNGGGPSNINNAGYKKYRVFVDLMGSKYLGKNTMLFVVDAYYGGPYHDQLHPVKYLMSPFNNNWCASLLMSLDEVALESVAFDILRTEFNGVNQGTHISPNWGGVDDYLHQAAEKANWAAGITYAPNGDNVAIGSLGVHEHWNNATDKQYSRDLFTNGTGIDLVSIPSTLVKHNSATAYYVTFTILNNTSPVEGALVTFNGVSTYTNSLGKAVFGNLTSKSGLAYTVKTTGLTDMTGTVDVSSDVTLPLDYNPPSTIIQSNIIAFPNPVISGTTIKYAVSTECKVNVSIYNTSGQLVENLVNSTQAAGDYSTRWNISGNNKIIQGIYICKINIGGQLSTYKLQVIK